MTHEPKTSRDGGGAAGGGGRGGGWGGIYTHEQLQQQNMLNISLKGQHVDIRRGGGGGGKGRGESALDAQALSALSCRFTSFCPHLRFMPHDKCNDCDRSSMSTSTYTRGKQEPATFDLTSHAGGEGGGGGGRVQGPKSLKPGERGGGGRGG
ncbi:unnamed protein product [Dicrocoelium dendriticum]|nr:unnamed protein product [Dicrocoelium dendriticum]